MASIHELKRANGAYASGMRLVSPINSLPLAATVFAPHDRSSCRELYRAADAPHTMDLKLDTVETVESDHLEISQKLTRSRLGRYRISFLSLGPGVWNNLKLEIIGTVRDKADVRNHSIAPTKVFI